MKRLKISSSLVGLFAAYAVVYQIYAACYTAPSIWTTDGCWNCVTLQNTGATDCSYETCSQGLNVFCACGTSGCTPAGPPYAVSGDWHNGTCNNNSVPAFCDNTYGAGSWSGSKQINTGGCGGT